MVVLSRADARGPDNDEAPYSCAWVLLGSTAIQRLATIVGLA